MDQNSRPLHKKSAASTDGRVATGTFEFQSETVLNLESRQSRIRERFQIGQGGAQASTENDFVMKCWTPGEIAFHLSEPGLYEIAAHSTYGNHDLAWSDRLVIVALKRVHMPPA